MSLAHYKYMARLEQVHANLRGLNQILQGVSLQNDLRASFEKFGLTKGTWMAVRHLPVAQAMFDAVPSLEALNVVGTTDVKMKTTKASTSSVVGDWLDNTADGVNNFIVTSKYHLDGLATSIDEAADDLEDGPGIDPEKLVYAVPVQTRLTQCNHLKIAYSVIDGLDPEDLDHEALQTAMDHLSHVSGMCKMGYDHIPGPAGMYCNEELEEGTFEELGYNRESTLELAEETIEIIEDAIELIKAKGDMLSQSLSQQADTVRDGNPQQHEEGLTDEADISQEDETMEATTMIAQYVSTVVCLLDCTGHIALNTLNTVTEATH